MYNSKKSLILIALSVIIGNVSATFSTNCMNNALKTMLEVFDISKEYQGLTEGLLSSSVSVGCFVGAILNMILHKTSIRKLIMIADVLLVLGSGILYFDNIFIFLVGRILTGIGAGIVTTFTTLYIKQISPTTLYGTLGAFYPITISIILTQTYGLIFLTDFDFWRIYFIVPAIFSIFRIILFVFYVKFSTPLNYCQLDQPEEAKLIIAKVYQVEYQEFIFEEVSKQAKIKRNVDILSPQYRQRMILAFYLQILFQFCGMNAILQYSTTIFSQIIGNQIAIYLTLTISIMKVSCYTYANILSMKYGRRKILLLGTGGMFIFTLGICVLSLILERTSQENIYYFSMQITLIVLIFAFLFSNFVSIGPLVPIYVPEIVPQKGVSASWILHWAGNVIVVLTFPIIIEIIGMSYVFMFYLLVIAIGVYIIFIFAVETLNRTDSQVDRIFARHQITAEKEYIIQN